MGDRPIPHAGEALRRVTRHGDFSGIKARLNAGETLTPKELAALDRLERGAPLKPGRKDPAVAFETVVCWRWLVEREGWSGPNARKLLAAMMGTTDNAIKERIKRAQGLGKNIADLCFDLHTQRKVPPALLRHRDAKGYCLHCVDNMGRATHVQCRCEVPPRPAFADTSEGAVVAALVAFHNMPGWS